MRRKNLVLLGLAAALCLSGCQKQEQSGDTTTAAEITDKESEGDSAAKTEAAEEGKVYPKGTVTFYMNGNPQYRQQYFETWLENHRDIAPEVSVEFVQVESNADAREKITMTALSGATEDLPDAVFLDRLNP